MKKGKYLIIIFMMLVCVTTFFGCADIEFIRAIDSSNTIIDKIAITLDESQVNKAGNELNTVVDMIENDMIKFRQSVNEWKESQFGEYPELFESVKKGIRVEVTKSKKTELSLAIEFSNWKMFGLFYGYAEAEDFEYTQFLEDKGPFINNILNVNYEDNEYGLFIINYSILKSAGITDSIKDFQVNGTNYYSKYSEYFYNRYGLEDVDISQIFAYPDDRLHSNADDSEVQGDLTLLKWDLNKKSDDFEMKIYKITANSVTWYIVALVISLIACVVIFVLIKKKTKGQPEVLIEKKDLEK